MRIFEVNTKKVEEEKQKAIDAGVNFSKNYKAPYVTALYEFNRQYGNNDVDGYVSEWDFDDIEEKKLSRKQKQGYRVLCVCGSDAVPMSGFFVSKKRCDALTESFNIRHFKVAAKSDNPNHPVLI